MTCTTVSVTCVRDHSYACIIIYTRGLGTPTATQHIFDSEKLVTFFFCSSSDGIRTRVIECGSPTLCQLSHFTTLGLVMRVQRLAVSGKAMFPQWPDGPATSQSIPAGHKYSACSLCSCYQQEGHAPFPEAEQWARVRRSCDVSTLMAGRQSARLVKQTEKRSLCSAV